MRILVTRPEPDATRTAARLQEMGHEAIPAPLLELEQARDLKLPSGKFDAVAVTSANAIRAAGELASLSDLFPVPAFAVGARTAEAVKAAGFEKVTYSKGDAADLAKLLIERVKKGGRVLHLAGEHRAQEFQVLLSPAGIEIVTCVLYRMGAAGSLPEQAAKALSAGKIDIVLHYSPRSAAVFVTLMERAGLSGKLPALRHLCLSQAVAAPIVAAKAKAEIAARPDENTLLSMI